MKTVSVSGFASTPSNADILKLKYGYLVVLIWTPTDEEVMQ